MIERLHENVIGPARQRGERVTLLGVSLGGLGSLAYALKHPNEVDEILLVAPYLGEDEVFEEFRSAGVLRDWQPSEPVDAKDYQRRLWMGIRDQWVVAGKAPPIRLIVGRDDHLIAASQLLRDDVLEPGAYREIDGAHKWSAWRNEFGRLLSGENRAR